MSALLLLLSLSVAYCAIPPVAAQTTAPVVIGKPFIANGTDPIKASNGWALTSHGISQNLYIIDGGFGTSSNSEPCLLEATMYGPVKTKLSPTIL